MCTILYCASTPSDFTLRELHLLLGGLDDERLATENISLIQIGLQDTQRNYYYYYYNSNKALSSAVRSVHTWHLER